MQRAFHRVLGSGASRQLHKMNGTMNNSSSPHTLTYLKRWSCQDKQLPAVDSINSIHIYDFDNTLFATPLPNKQLWQQGTLGTLMGEHAFIGTGGWWHNPDILAATGRGLQEEEARAWEGHWNESVVDLVRMSMQEKDSLTVLLTGRGEARYADLIKRMVVAKGLDFDLLLLKPKASPNGEAIPSTLKYKQKVFRDIIYTYAQAEEIRVYEDRPKHVDAFNEYFEKLNKSLLSEMYPPRDPIEFKVVPVSEQELLMNPVSEVQEVQKMINTHNLAIREGSTVTRAKPQKINRTVFHTGYLISPKESERLKALVNLPADVQESKVNHLANNILIAPGPARKEDLDRVGGIGAQVRWRVTALGSIQGKVWAARVQPVDPSVKPRTQNITPHVVLAVLRGVKAGEANGIRTWQNATPEQALEFDSTVGEKVSLSIVDEVPDYTPRNQRGTRKHPRDEDSPPLGPRQNGPRQPQQRGKGPQGAWGNKSASNGYAAPRGGNNARGSGQRGGGGAAGGFRGGRRGNARGGGGRGGGRGAYRSLDDSAGQSYGSGGMQY